MQIIFVLKWVLGNFYKKYYEKYLTKINFELGCVMIKENYEKIFINLNCQNSSCPPSSFKKNQFIELCATQVYIKIKKKFKSYLIINTCLIIRSNFRR